MIIDVFSHVLPPRYLAERNRRAGTRLATQYGKYFRANPGLTDLEVRFRSMDKYPDVTHLLTIAGPNVESVLDPADAALAETDRAIRDLRFRGVEIFTDINGKPVDAAEFL